MKIKNECIPCLVRQAVEVAELMASDKETQEKIIKHGLERMNELDFNETAPAVAKDLHHYVRRVTGNLDPYKALKDTYNKIAEELVQTLKLENKVAESSDPFDTACRLSIAGNIIDFGLGISLDRSDVQCSIEESLVRPISGDSTELLKCCVARADKIMFLTDNAGEIVFDKLLIKQLPVDRVTYVVKGGPIVNDATMEDAQDVGMTELVRVIDNGYDAQGTLLEYCSEEFKKAFDAADLIICKGQANYETLSDLKDPRLFYLLRAKCISIAEDIGCPKGAFVIKQHL